MTERGTMKLTVELAERGADLTERVADLVEGLTVVVGSLEQGVDRARVTFLGGVDSLVELAVRVAGTGHTVQRVCLDGVGYCAWLEGSNLTLGRAERVVRAIEGARVTAVWA